MIFQLCLHQHEVEVYSLLETGHNTSFLDFFFLFGNLQLSSGGVYSAPSMGRGEGGTLWLQRGSLPCRKRKKSMNTSVGKVGRYKVVILSQAVGCSSTYLTYLFMSAALGLIAPNEKLVIPRAICSW